MLSLGDLPNFTLKTFTALTSCSDNRAVLLLSCVGCQFFCNKLVHWIDPHSHRIQKVDLFNHVPATDCCIFGILIAGLSARYVLHYILVNNRRTTTTKYIRNYALICKCFFLFWYFTVRTYRMSFDLINDQIHIFMRGDSRVNPRKAICIISFNHLRT